MYMQIIIYITDTEFDIWKITPKKAQTRWAFLCYNNP